MTAKYIQLTLIPVNRDFFRKQSNDKTNQSMKTDQSIKTDQSVRLLDQLPGLFMPDIL